MWERLREWVLRWTDQKDERPEWPREGFSAAYEDVTRENITAVIAGKLAALTIGDSSFALTAPGGERGALIAEALERLWKEDARRVTARAFGKGAAVLVPAVTETGRVEITEADQDRVLILRRDAGRPVSAALCLADGRAGNELCHLIAHYELKGDAHRIRYMAVTDGGAPVPLARVPGWERLPEEITVGRVDRLLLGFLKCPADPRRNGAELGVPITYGAEPLLEELREHLRIYRREYKLTRPMLGLDSTLWQTEDRSIGQVRRTVQDGDDPFIPFDAPALDGRGVWQYYAPAIRWEAMEARLKSLCLRIEKACGLSQGILTERQSVNYLNRDEVRAAMYDTYSVLRAMRYGWERAMEDLALAADALAERFALTPRGSRAAPVCAFDWDTSLIESTAEAFDQELKLHAAGAMSAPELRQWVLGGTLKEAEAAVDRIQAERERKERRS